MTFQWRIILLLLGLCIAVHVIRQLYSHFDMRSYAGLINSQYKPVNSSDSWSQVDPSLFWFIQISDIHVSFHGDIERVHDLESFCVNHIPIIRPDLVLVSGDLSDSKSLDQYASQQYEDEWRSYLNVIEQSGVLNYTHWIDLRGNHDVFNVPEHGHHRNFYAKYSVQGKLYHTSYQHTVEKSFGNYSFVILDACPKIGLKRPFNFFGYINEAEASHVSSLVDQIQSSNHTFWVGHYPTSTIISPHIDLRQMVGQTGFAYLCGHLHTFYGRLRQMYALQPQGYLELELGDWRDDRYYRIVVVDHDLVSFVDYRLSSGLNPDGPDWPVGVISNPKSSDFLLPHKEPLARILSSTHIRILAWSPWPIKSISVHIDGLFVGLASSTITNQSSSTTSPPLYQLAWNASAYADGRFHSISALIEDEKGNSRQLAHTFIVSGSPSWRFTRTSYFLHTDFSHSLRVIFFTTWSVFILMILVPRIPLRWIRSILFKTRLGVGLYRVGQCDAFALMHSAYACYVLALPTFIGYVVEEHVGLVFSFGILITNTFVYDSLTYYAEILQMWLMLAIGYLPLLYCYGISSGSVVGIGSLPVKYKPSPNRLLLYVVGTIYTVMQLAFHFWSTFAPYGLLAFLLAPGRIIPLYLVWYMIVKVP